MFYKYKFEFLIGINLQEEDQKWKLLNYDLLKVIIKCDISKRMSFRYPFFSKINKYKNFESIVT